MIKKLRILFLLGILLTVGLNAWRAQSRATEWRNTLFVSVYPINADGSRTSEAYIRTLSDESFEGIENFIAEEAQHHGISTTRLVDFSLAPAISVLPPELDAQGSALDNILWSLRLRHWAWSETPDTRLKPHIRLYVLYHDPEIRQVLPHSRGLQKGQIGIIHAFANRRMQGSNAFVIAHEFLHTLGATDKYDLSTTQPIWPDGYAEPRRTPRLPQRYAEVMGGRIPLTESSAEIPAGFHQAMIGEATAREIGWIGSAP